MKYIVAIAMVIVLVGMLAVPAFADPGNANGAVKYDLVNQQGNVVGFVIGQSNASGEFGAIMFEIHLNVPGEFDEMMPDACIDPGAVGGPCTFIGEVMLNNQGCGNLKFKYPLPTDYWPNLGAWMGTVNVGPASTAMMTIPLK